VAERIIRAFGRDVELEHLVGKIVVDLDGQAVRLWIPQKRHFEAVAHAPIELLG
jgi:hypothetical protein